MISFWTHTHDYWQAGGPLLVPIAVVCLGIWVYFLRSRAALLQALREARTVAETLELCEPGCGTESVTRRLAEHKGGIAAMLRVALDDIRQGTRPMDALTTRERECLDWLRRDFILLAALTAAAPLLGLLGTVMGMIDTFDAVSAISGNTGSRVAAGISRALITTQFGLVVALPGFFGLARLQRMLRNAEVLVASCRAHVLDRIHPRGHAAG
jgi:biopolymer transport protein ExbB